MLDGAAIEVRMWLSHLKTEKGIDLATGRTPTKCRQEAEEFEADPCIEEAADVFISLIASCAYLGIHPDDLARAALNKIKVNASRIWEQLEDGTFQHV